jgi:hypothetical protein
MTSLKTEVERRRSFAGLEEAALLNLMRASDGFERAPQITEAGLELLRAMDPAIERMPKDLLGHMSAAEIAELNRLLELARKGVEGPRPAKARGDRICCEGKE